MFCAKCGASLKDDAMQCDKCGAPVRIRPAAETKGEASSWFSVPDDEALERRRPDSEWKTDRKQKKEEKNAGREDAFRDPVYYEEVTDELDVGEILRIARGQEGEDQYGEAAYSEDLYGEDTYDMEEVPLPLMERVRRRLAEAHHIRAEAADEKAMARHLARAEKYYERQESMADRLREERAQKAEELRLRRIRQDEEWHEQKWFEEALRKELEEERAARRASEEGLEQEKRAWREETARLRREAEAPEDAKDILAKETEAPKGESALSAWEKKAPGEESARPVWETDARKGESARPAWEKKAPGEESTRSAWEKRAPEEDIFRTGQDTDVRREDTPHTRAYPGQAEPVSAVDEAYLRKVRAARARRRAQEDAQDGFDRFLGKYGLTKEIAVRIATLFLIALLSMIYVLGRGGSTANAGSLPADGMTGTPALAEPDAEGEEAEEESAVPTGGGDFQ